MREEVIKKIRISHDSNRFKDISLINAKFKVFDHPYSNPWEVNLKTKDIINVDTYAKIQFLIEGYQYYSEGTVFVSLESINENSDIRTFVFKGNSELLPLQYYILSNKIYMIAAEKVSFNRTSVNIFSYIRQNLD